MRPVIRYSEAFKLKVVRDLEEGRYGNPTEAGLAHGVTGKGTVARWVRQYGKNHLLRKVVVVMKADEQAEVRALRKRVRGLEKALADAHLDAASCTGAGRTARTCSTRSRTSGAGAAS
jgi:transposase-like protein